MFSTKYPVEKKKFLAESVWYKKVWLKIFGTKKKKVTGLKLLADVTETKGDSPWTGGRGESVLGTAGGEGWIDGGGRG